MDNSLACAAEIASSPPKERRVHHLPPLKTGGGLLEQRGMQLEITLLPGTLDA